jgi:hypothetical protein
MITNTTLRARARAGLQAVAWTAGITAGVLLLLVFAVFMIWAMDGRADRTASGARSRSLYESARAATMIVVPKEAVFHSASEHTNYMLYLFEAEFSLPAGKSPEEWLQAIASNSQLSDYQKSKYVYDGGGDEKLVEYVPSRATFHMRIRID